MRTTRWWRILFKTTCTRIYKACPLLLPAVFASHREVVQSSMRGDRETILQTLRSRQHWWGAWMPLYWSSLGVFPLSLLRQTSISLSGVPELLFPPAFPCSPITSSSTQKEKHQQPSSKQMALTPLPITPFTHNERQAQQDGTKRKREERKGLNRCFKSREEERRGTQRQGKATQGRSKQARN